MEFLTKILSKNNKVVFDVENSDHGDSGMQWYYGALVTPDNEEYEFSICVMHESNSGTSFNKLTWLDNKPNPDNHLEIEKEILTAFDWKEINNVHEQNEILN
jgi:hypothetical protein